MVPGCFCMQDVFASEDTFTKDMSDHVSPQAMHISLQKYSFGCDLGSQLGHDPAEMCPQMTICKINSNCDLLGGPAGELVTEVLHLMPKEILL